jgi:aryl-alcohol dehydrogenase-like predicted oxidoreductase
MNLKFVLGIEKKIDYDLLDANFDLDQNFIDVSPLYEEGEKCIGKYKKRNNLEIFTKIGLSKKNYGLSKKSIFSSFETSLKNLKVDKINTVFIHVWDFSKNLEEVKDSLLSLKDKYKINLGVSNTPAWIISQMGIFNSIQVEYNLCNTTSEIELIPMARYNNIKIFSYSPFFNGLVFKPNKIYNKNYRKKIKKIKNKYKILEVSLGIQSKENLVPIIRTDNIEHLTSNYNILCLKKNTEQINKYLENPIITPYNVFNSKTIKRLKNE